jgi:uncharacterized protein (UPF0276 family)
MNVLTSVQNIAMRRNSLKQPKKGIVTIDKQFLAKLEESLKKLTKSNEKVKQVIKEKLVLEDVCTKLRLKVKMLKEERCLYYLDRETLMSQN